MNILALQLKRIGDLILTTPAIDALRQARPEARITLIVADACGELLPAIEGIDRGFVFRRGRLNGKVWAAILGARFDVCLDFTGNDRSAFLALLSRAHQRLTFDGVRKASKLRALAYGEFVPSSVRERHTLDHYLDLAHGLGEPVGVRSGSWTRPKNGNAFTDPDLTPETSPPASPRLTLPISAQLAAKELAKEPDYIVIHPGTARPDKYWVPERWARVIEHLQERHGARCFITGGSDPAEQAHIAQIQSALSSPVPSLAGKMDLLTFAALVAGASACLSCDTATVHLAAAFSRPQIALYGPINPYQWRPRHPHAIILSAAHPTAPLTEFQPRMKSAPMDALSTELVIRATDCLLAMSPSAAETDGKPD